MPADPRKSAAQQARTAIAKADGLVTTADLRERWGSPGKPLSADRVKDLVGEAGFPEPVYPPKGDERSGVRKVWLGADVDRWWSERQSRPGRPGPKPRQLTAQNTKDEQ